MRVDPSFADEQKTWDAPRIVVEDATAGELTTDTVVAVPAAVARRQSAATSSTQSRDFEDAMRGRETAAMRGFVWLVMTLSAAVLAAAPLLALDRIQAATLIMGTAIATAGALRTRARIRRGALEARDIGVMGFAAMIGGSLGIYTFGYFSPAPLATIMGVFFFALQRDRRVAVGTFACTCASHFGVMILQTFDAIPDHGVISVEHVPERHRLVATLLVQLVFFLTFFLARSTHRAIMVSARRLEESTRALAQREALLEEARRELERVLEVGGPGRFTEQRLGPWQLGVLCGRGAMGDVYSATHVHEGTRAAVKLLTRESCREADAVRRFLREARIAGSIDVPNVVRVLEVGADDAPVPYIAMELLEGKDLATMLRQHRRLPKEELLEMLGQVARGLDAAHALGVVHRDLKPQNVFRADTPDGPVWKLLDFGVSRVIDVDSSLTRGQAIGTPSYMSPEQARGHHCDQRADIFALGVLAYRALTGRPPFTGQEVPQILYRVVYGMPPRPSQVIDLPTVVDDVLAIALAKRPADRFARATELVQALALALEGVSTPEWHERARRLTTRLPWGRELKVDGVREPDDEPAPRAEA